MEGRGKPVWALQTPFPAILSSIKMRSNSSKNLNFTRILSHFSSQTVARNDTVLHSACVACKCVTLHCGVCKYLPLFFARCMLSAHVLKKRKVCTSQEAACILERSSNQQASKGFTKGPSNRS
eukprot:1148786-Pelagomonas_calceolata.AAC.4